MKSRVAKMLHARADVDQALNAVLGVTATAAADQPASPAVALLDAHLVEMHIERARQALRRFEEAVHGA